MLLKPSWILFLLTIKTFKQDVTLLENVISPYKTFVRITFNV